MLNKTEVESVLRREADILGRLDNVRRLIEMETTLVTCEGCGMYGGFKNYTRKDGIIFGDNLRDDLRDQIQRQLLSIVALCYGDNPDIGEPNPMLYWKDNPVDGKCSIDAFRDMWNDCLEWNG